jgi:Uma2 family endonuclease
MSPLFELEDDKGIISDLVKVLLEELEIEFRDAGSTTLKNEEMGRAVEPDSSFYMANEGAVRGKKRIYLRTDPPPDLAIEIEITSRTNLKIYEALGVPEVWRYDGGDRLQINVLQDGKYVESEVSYNFRNLPELKGAIASHLQDSKVNGRNATMKAFRSWVKKELIINN